VLAAQVSKADLLDFPELPSVPVDTPVGGNTPHDDDDDIGTHVMQRFRSYLLLVA
jgi:hypothetical protein